MRPPGLLAVPAKQVRSVVKAILEGPPHLDAGLDVKPQVFQQAVPFFQWKELSDVATHFGRRGHAAREVSAVLAAELSHRLSTSVQEAPAKGLSSSSSSSSSSRAAAPKAAAKAFQGATGREVATVVYAFSKLREQLPEYEELYMTVVDGVQNRRWTFNRLQASLVATALVDVEVEVAETVPHLVNPILDSLREDSLAQQNLTLDELRYLLHGASRMQGLLAEDIDLLGNLISKQVSRTKDFSKIAHIIVSWISMPIPADAKESHQQVLVAACKKLLSIPIDEQRRPAHPLPKAGMAPVIATFMLRESQQLVPPLTPPDMGQISRALVSISRASSRQGDQDRAPARSFSLEDWLEMMPPILSYCEAHSTDNPGFSRAQKELPVWASQMLGHIPFKARFSGIRVEPRPLRQLLQLLKRYKASPLPDAKFYEWAADEVIAAHERGTAPELLATLVSDLVSSLSKKKRKQLTKILVSTRETPEIQDMEDMPKVRVFQTATISEVPWKHVKATASPVASLALKSQEPAPHTLAAASAPAPAAAAPQLSAAGAGEDLWNLLGPSETQRSSQSAATSRRAFVLSENKGVRLKAPAEVAKTPIAEEELVNLTSKLERALERIASLESKLEDQAVSRSQSKPAKERETITATRENRPHEPLSTDSAKEAVATSSGSSLEASSAGFGWMGTLGLGASLSRSWGSAGLATQSSTENRLPPHMAMVHLHQPFNFEEWRRNESPRVQAEKLRVVIPPDHIPFWPVPKKS